MPSFKFLDLPAELRSLIIENVLFDRCQPPTKPSKTNRTIFRDIPYNAWRCRAYYQEQQHNTQGPSNSLSLLLTSRQISSETQAILHLNPTDYHLDISMLNEVDIFPTWLSVPRLTPCISTLTASVRLFGHIISPQNVASQVGDGGHLGFQWSFYAVLERFLAYGPVAQKTPNNNKSTHPSQNNPNPSSMDRGITIKTLILDFSSATDKTDPDLTFPPPEIDYTLWRIRHTSRRHPLLLRAGVDLMEHKPRPEFVAKYLTQYIAGLLSMNYHTASYGRMLYERIGAIRVLVDGRVYREFDLAEELAELRRRSYMICHRLSRLS
ncbi:hypothetical protein BDW59DRAFT_157195 [Aspergillus cavernicola]|uniref:F-box domain-containing protein n=1 Tax=Aspergillus cavernicola TaxID=176166 RepID=A0ABR4IZ40_9EURO